MAGSATPGRDRPAAASGRRRVRNDKRYPAIPPRGITGHEMKKTKENSGPRFAVSVAIDFGDSKTRLVVQPADSGQVSARRVRRPWGWNNPDAHCRAGRRRALVSFDYPFLELGYEEQASQ